MVQITHPKESESLQNQEYFGRTLHGMERTIYNFTEGGIGKKEIENVKYLSSMILRTFILQGITARLVTF